MTTVARPKIGRPPRPLAERFNKKVVVSDGDGCWMWVGYVRPDGFGTITYDGGRRSELVHRVAWELVHGELPDRFHVLHYCGVRACVRPDHLHACANEDVNRITARPFADRLNEMIDRSGGPDACWNWLGLVGSGGYGMIWRGSRASGRKVPAHRASYEAKYGPIPPGRLYACHRCDNRRCCNPDHIFIGTPADNQADMRDKDRSAFGPRNSQTKVAPEAVRQIRARIASGDPVTCVARDFGVARHTVRSIASGKTHRRVV